VTISPIRGRIPAERTKTKFGMRDRVADVIICFKFYRNRLRGFRAVRGQEWGSSIDFDNHKLSITLVSLNLIVKSNGLVKGIRTLLRTFHVSWYPKTQILFGGDCSIMLQSYPLRRLHQLTHSLTYNTYCSQNYFFYIFSERELAVRLSSVVCRLTSIVCRL